MLCDVWGWQGHIWERPKYNNALERIEVIEKCRCGKTREVKVFRPMPDMEPVEDYDGDFVSPWMTIGNIIGLIIFMIIFINILLPLLVNVLNGCPNPINGTGC